VIMQLTIEARRLSRPCCLQTRSERDPGGEVGFKMAASAAPSEMLSAAANGEAFEAGDRVDWQVRCRPDPGAGTANRGGG